MNTTVERLEGNTAKVTVTVPAADVDRYIEKAYKSVASQVKIPGFRPGKAPKSVLDAQVGRDYVLSEATETLVNESYSRAIEAESLRPIAPPEVDELVPAVPGEDYTFTAQVDLRPEFTITSTEGLTVTIPPEAATDKEIQMQVEYIRERFATLDPVEDRGVQADDFVLISFVGLVDGEPYEGNTVDRYLYEMGRGVMPKEFDDGIIGAKPGETLHIEFPIPESSSVVEFIGRTATFDITVHEVKAKVLPELDDEFAGNVGGFETYDAFLADIRGKMDQNQIVAHNQAKERAARKALAERAEGEVPAPMVESRTNSMLRDFMNGLEARQMTLERYIAATGVDGEKIEEDIRAAALDSLREELALEALVRTLGLEITEADMELEYAEIADTMKSSVEEVKARWQEMGMVALITEQATHRKAVLWLLENVETVIEDSTLGTEEA